MILAGSSQGIPQVQVTLSKLTKLLCTNPDVTDTASSIMLFCPYVVHFCTTKATHCAHKKSETYDVFGPSGEYIILQLQAVERVD